eukprot:Platyproteum_vivax@DN12011_c0_g1_i1.p1
MKSLFISVSVVMLMLMASVFFYTLLFSPSITTCGDSLLVSRFRPQCQKAKKNLNIDGAILFEGLVRDARSHLEAQRGKYNCSEQSLPWYFWKSSQASAYKGYNFGDDVNKDIASKILNTNPHFTNNKNHKKVMSVGSVFVHAQGGDVIMGAGLKSEDIDQTLIKALTHVDTHIGSVRGPLTCKALESKGLSCGKAMGDPALMINVLLWPELKPLARSVYPFCGVFHARDTHLIAEATARFPYVKQISVSVEKPKIMAEELVKCGMVISSSLHGVIFSDALGVPVQWVHNKKSNQPIFKYQDYMLSVGRTTDCYVPSLEEAIVHGKALPFLAKEFLYNVAIDYINAFPFERVCKINLGS